MSERDDDLPRTFSVSEVVARKMIVRATTRVALATMMLWRMPQSLLSPGLPLWSLVPVRPGSSGFGSPGVAERSPALLRGVRRGSAYRVRGAMSHGARHARAFGSNNVDSVQQPAAAKRRGQERVRPSGRRHGDRVATVTASPRANPVDTRHQTERLIDVDTGAGRRVPPGAARRHAGPGPSAADQAPARPRPAPHARVMDARRRHGPVRAMQRRLGHESITTTTETYAHLMPDQQRAAADAAAKALSGLVPARYG